MLNETGSSKSTNPIIGRVLRASTRGFDCGTHSTDIDFRHDFGSFVKTPIADRHHASQILAIGLIYKIEIKDDPLVSELVLGDYVPFNVLLDQRENRMIPVEIKVLNVGYIADGRIVHSLPPRPPMSLSDVALCNQEEVYYFTQKTDYLRLILGASEVPADDLAAATIRYAATARHDEAEAYAFIVQSGQRLARELASDMKRLAHVLSLIRP